MKNLTPIKSYFDPFINRKSIFKENAKKSGIYCWNNTITNKLYVGSSVDLSRRLRNYLSYKYLEKESLRGNSLIIKALSKYNYHNFTLNILEYCDTTSLIQREQHYIDTLKPEYNIRLKANSPLGIKHKFLRNKTQLNLKNHK